MPAFQSYFKKYKSVLRKVIFQAKKDFNNDTIKQIRNLGRATWKVVNDELGKPNLSHKCIVLTDHEGTVENQRDVEIKLNKSFT